MSHGKLQREMLPWFTTDALPCTIIRERPQWFFSSYVSSSGLQIETTQQGSKPTPSVTVLKPWDGWFVSGVPYFDGRGGASGGSDWNTVHTHAHPYTHLPSSTWQWSAHLPPFATIRSTSVTVCKTGWGSSPLLTWQVVTYKFRCGHAPQTTPVYLLFYSIDAKMFKVTTACSFPRLYTLIIETLNIFWAADWGRTLTEWGNVSVTGLTPPGRMSIRCSFKEARHQLLLWGPEGLSMLCFQPTRETSRCPVLNERQADLCPRCWNSGSLFSFSIHMSAEKKCVHIEMNVGFSINTQEKRVILQFWGNKML